jgi:hypothetical protein
VHADADVVGEYGIHSDASRRFATLFDKTAIISPVDATRRNRKRDGGGGGGGASSSSSTAAAAAAADTPGLWLCGHFCAKAFHCMATDLAKPENKNKTMVFWQTKSRVQPMGSSDEWDRMRQMPPVVRKWAEEGKAESALRPGLVNTAGGCAADYRAVTTVVV